MVQIQEDEVLGRRAGQMAGWRGDVRAVLLKSACHRERVRRRYPHNEILLLTATRVGLEGRQCTEISQRNREKYWMISRTCGI